MPHTFALGRRSLLRGFNNSTFAMTTELLTNRVVSPGRLEPAGSPGGFWKVLRAFAQAFGGATELSAKLELLVPEEQVDGVRRYFEKRI